MKLKTKFRDEDFDLGEVTDVAVSTSSDGRIKAQAEAKSGGVSTFFYDKLETFYNNWEDVVEEPEEQKDSALDLMIIALTGFIASERPDRDKFDLKDCRQMLEKLMAWKRLENIGFRFNRWFIPKGPETLHIKLVIEAKIDGPGSLNDLDLLFRR